jgi:hypothetical protein
MGAPGMAAETQATVVTGLVNPTVQRILIILAAYSGYESGETAEFWSATGEIISTEELVLAAKLGEFSHGAGEFLEDLFSDAKTTARDQQQQSPPNTPKSPASQPPLPNPKNLPSKCKL